MLIRADASRIPLPDRCVQVVVTSPPYLEQRSYGDSPLEGGHEGSLEGYVRWLAGVFDEYARVLRDDGLAWLNIGDKANGSGGAGGDWTSLAWAHHQSGIMVIRTAMPVAYPSFRERFAGLLDAEVLDLGQALVDRIDAYLDREAPPECLRHGDLRLDNILFDQSGRTACLLDWQTVAMGRGANDVAYLIGTSFAGIFFDNCANNGLLTLTLDEAEVARLSAQAADPATNRFEIDLGAQVLRTAEGHMSFAIDALRRDRFLHGLDPIGATLQSADAIRAFEAQHLGAHPWLEPAA